MLVCTFLPLHPAEILGSLSEWAVVTVGPAAADAELQLTMILNPLTREAQRISQVRGCCSSLRAQLGRAR